MRSVRLTDDVGLDLDRQLGADGVELFRRYDLAPALAALAQPGAFEALELGPWPGGRLAVPTARTGGAFNLFAGLDASDDVVYAVDIWLDGFPD